MKKIVTIDAVPGCATLPAILAGTPGFTVKTPVAVPGKTYIRIHPKYFGYEGREFVYFFIDSVNIKERT